MNSKSIKIAGLLILMSGVGASSAFSQEFATAEMTVSAKVVEGVTVQNNSPSNFDLMATGMFLSGGMQLKGNTQSATVVSMPGKINLVDNRGNAIELSIQPGNKANSMEKDVAYRYNWNSGTKEEVKKGTYAGNVTTTVEYL